MGSRIKTREDFLLLRFGRLFSADIGKFQEIVHDVSFFGLKLDVNRDGLKVF